MFEGKPRYVLEPKNPIKYFKYLVGKPNSRVYQLTQGYIGDCYIRETRPLDGIGGSSFSFAFETMVNRELVSIETAITELDYNKLNTKVGHVLTKSRILIPETDHVWLVDFFQTPKVDGYYLVMADVGLAQGQTVPNSTPEYIVDALLYELPRADKRFSSFNLTKPNKVKRLLSEIKNEKRKFA